MAIIYKGNRPESVKKDAKYRIVSEDGKPVVGMSYTTATGEHWAPTVDNHPDLIRKVNAVKSEINGVLGGQFYINEYRQVIVPAKDDYYYAGEYLNDLSFNFEGQTLSGQAVDEDGNQLEEGDDWENALMGIPYIICAGGNDIRYELQLRPKVKVRARLSKVTSSKQAADLAHRLSGLIGHYQGGRFYINEYEEMFKPINMGAWVKYIYIGKLKDTDPWFPKPKYDDTDININLSIEQKGIKYEKQEFSLRHTESLEVLEDLLGFKL